MKKGFLAVCTAIGATAGAVTTGYLVSKQISQKSKKVEKFKRYYNMLNQWLMLKQEQKKLEDFFIARGYETIAIYGIGEMGNRLYDELKASKIKVLYAIDKNVENTYSELIVYALDANLPEVDAIIVSPIFAYEEIKKQLENMTDCPIINLEDVIYCM